MFPNVSLTMQTMKSHYGKEVISIEVISYLWLGTLTMSLKKKESLRNCFISKTYQNNFHVNSTLSKKLVYSKELHNST